MLSHNGINDLNSTFSIVWSDGNSKGEMFIRSTYRLHIEGKHRAVKSTPCYLVVTLLSIYFLSVRTKLGYLYLSTLMNFDFLPFKVVYPFSKDWGLSLICCLLQQLLVLPLLVVLTRNWSLPSKDNDIISSCNIFVYLKFNILSDTLLLKWQINETKKLLNTQTLTLPPWLWCRVS